MPLTIACRMIWRTLFSWSPVAAAISAKETSDPAGKEWGRRNRTMACWLMSSSCYLAVSVHQLSGALRYSVAHRIAHQVFPRPKRQTPQFEGVINNCHPCRFDFELDFGHQSVPRPVLGERRRGQVVSDQVVVQFGRIGRDPG